ncbi:MAG: DUF2096 domain-containing protein [Candidatus Bathyarchaeota archaeon]|nr:DUF2096 domain-containing protein [Candidatus Bathyarchaeota archaeon]
MGHNLATWKTLEDLMIELRKKGVSVPSNVVEDLRAARSMIKLTSMEDSRGEVFQKAEEYLANVEAYLITEAQKVFGSEKTDEWFKRLEEASAQVCEELKEEDKFITGVPRDQKWIRVEPIDNLPAERIQQIAKEHNLGVKPQNNGRLVVFGQPEDIKQFLKAMAPQKTS